MNIFGGIYPRPPVDYGGPSIRYRDVPAAAPRPRLWKLLARITALGVEVHYQLGRWPGGDLDVEFERDLLTEMTCITNDMASRETFVPDEGIMLQRSARQRPTELMVKIVPLGAPPPGPYNGIWSN